MPLVGIDASSGLVALAAPCGARHAETMSTLDDHPSDDRPDGPESTTPVAGSAGHPPAAAAAPAPADNPTPVTPAGPAAAPPPAAPVPPPVAAAAPVPPGPGGTPPPGPPPPGARPRGSGGWWRQPGASRLTLVGIIGLVVGFILGGMATAVIAVAIDHGIGPHRGVVHSRYDRGWRPGGPGQQGGPGGPMHHRDHMPPAPVKPPSPSPVPTSS
jgi:hypothetical protein